MKEATPELVLRTFLVYVLFSSAALASPAETVTKLHETLLTAAQQGEQLGYDGRYALLEPIVRATHDIPFICSVTIGRRNWNAMEEADREAFAETFLRLSTATYAHRFRSYRGETFVIVDESADGDSAVVRSRLTLADGRALDFDYILRPSDQGWAIINIIVDGVSDLALKRAEYTRILKSGGVPDLMANLETQIADLEAPD